jgi:hypothetical protein
MGGAPVRMFYQENLERIQTGITDPAKH